MGGVELLKCETGLRWSVLSRGRGRNRLNLSSRTDWVLGSSGVCLPYLEIHFLVTVKLDEDIVSAMYDRSSRIEVLR